MNVYRFLFPFVLIVSGCSFDDFGIFKGAPDMTTIPDLVEQGQTDLMMLDLRTAPDLIDASSVDLVNVDLATRCNNNGTQDGKETGVDCGGPDCGKCAGDICLIADDCASRSCTQFICGPWIALENSLSHVIRAMPYNGLPGNMTPIPKLGKHQFADQGLQLVAYARYDNDMESDADGTEVMCTSDKTLVPYAPQRIAIASLPVFACKYK